jgi:hypothetical protein
MYLFVCKDLIGLYILTEHYFFYLRNFNCLHAGVCRLHYFIFGGGRLVSFASLVMYCIDTIGRIVKNHCTELLYPFLYSMPIAIQIIIRLCKIGGQSNTRKSNQRVCLKKVMTSFISAGLKIFALHDGGKNVSNGALDNRNVTLRCCYLM